MVCVEYDYFNYANSVDLTLDIDSVEPDVACL